MQMSGRATYADEQADVSGEVLERTRRPVAEAVAAGGRANRSCGEAFVLRLCLDLQIDAMLLALGAAAVEADLLRVVSGPRADRAPRERLPTTSSRGTVQTAGTAAGADPGAGVQARVDSGHWRSWLDEDVDFVCRLAVEVVAAGVRLPATLGENAPAAFVDNLAARYEAMWSLLEDLDRRVPATARQAGARAADTAREHVRRRLAWLRGERAVRSDVVAASGVVPAVVPAVVLSGELPG
jgi:hypothetical protein